jgi:hypothetical protein
MERRSFFKAMLIAAASAAGASPAWAMGEEERFTIGLLQYTGGNPNPRPTALRRLLQELEKRTSVEVQSKTPLIDVSDPIELFKHPMVVLAGDRGFPAWEDKVVEHMRQYLQAGGFLLVDSSEGTQSGEFITSVKRELGRIFGPDAIKRVGKDHVLYKSFFLIKEAVGRVMVSPFMDGVLDNDRLAVVISYNDLLGALARDNFGVWEYEVSPGGERQREMSFRLGINLAMYALCLNYKEDQVHIPFILKRRKWKVEP